MRPARSLAAVMAAVLLQGDLAWSQWLQDGSQKVKETEPNAVVSTSTARPTMIQLDGRNLRVIQVEDLWSVSEPPHGVRGQAWGVRLEDKRRSLDHYDARFAG